MHNEICIMLRKGMYDKVDEWSRRLAAEFSLDSKKTIDLIDKITGGLGYTKEEPLDESRMNYVGYYIAWPDMLSNGVRILEIGTGLGRTAFIVHYSIKPRLYLTIDSSIEMLHIALYANPIEDYKKVLWIDDVKIVYGDAVRILDCLNDTFDHIIHDGGPNPRRNKRLYSKKIFNTLGILLRKGGTLSVFIGSYRVMQDAIYNNLIDTGFKIVETVPLPFSKARVIHAVKS